MVLLFFTQSGYADSMDKSEIIKTLEKNNLKSLVQLVDKGALVLDDSGTTINKMQLKRNGASYYNATASTAKFWYRGMPATEVNNLIAVGYSSLNWNVESFVGIAPEFDYSLGYLWIKNPGVVVEFGTDSNGWLYQDWSGKKCQIKAEGGGTYGLGLKGTFASCDKKKFPVNTRALGEVFSDWMARTVVTTRVVWVLVPR